MKNQSLIMGRFECRNLLQRTLGKEIYMLYNHSSSEYYIGKFQPRSKLDKTSLKNVLHEASFLQQLQGHTGFPLMYWSGVEGNQILLIVQYLGYTLQQRHRQCEGRFSLKTTCMLGIKILDMLRLMHEKGIIHRNLSPSVVQFGRGFKSAELYFNDLIDCKKFRNKKTFSHMSSKKNIKYSYDNMFGSHRFHQGEQISRIDDIENLVNMLIFLNTGVRPFKKGVYSKQTIPGFLNQMLEKCRQHEFDEEPAYEWFNQKLKSVLFHNSYDEDGLYDWMTAQSKRERLAVSKYIPNLRVEADKQLLSEVYEPYEQGIDIDEITTKHLNMVGEISAKSRQQELRKPNSILVSANVEQKLRNRKPTKGQKNDCMLM